MAPHQLPSGTQPGDMVKLGKQCPGWGELGAQGGDAVIDTKPISKITPASGSSGKENHWAREGDVKNAVDYSLGCSK